jgi:hypothetical protein
MWLGVDAVLDGAARLHFCTHDGCADNEHASL